MTTQGKRADLVDGRLVLNMGEYGKDAEGKWWARPPVQGFGMGRLGNHDITEHEDGTITVSPSILMDWGEGRTWHGYLRKGIWEEV